MLEDLVRLANHLDSKGLCKEADALDAIIKLWDSLGFRQTQKRVGPEKSPYEKAVDRLDNQINLIEKMIIRLRSGGEDITEYNQNQKDLPKLIERKKQLIEKRDSLKNFRAHKTK